jgi:hypothetical protein
MRRSNFHYRTSLRMITTNQQQTPIPYFRCCSLENRFHHHTSPSSSLSDSFPNNITVSLEYLSLQSRFWFDPTDLFWFWLEEQKQPWESKRVLSSFLGEIKCGYIVDDPLFHNNQKPTIQLLQDFAPSIYFPPLQQQQQQTTKN